MTSSRPPGSRYLCVHGHFYQPPRENPWLEAVEVQDSAYPFHDWNQRITEECYGQNASSRILDGEGLIARIVNNYARISFDFGPTLLAWLQTERPEVYAAVLRADRESQERFGGHGSAMAQAYGHAILPLCDERDLRTQVHWGVRDFEHRFGRPPEGMWLPETAVDVASLEALVDEGVRFTVLEPHQAACWRAEGEPEWRSTQDAGIDPRRPYRCPLPSGRSIALFFYDGPVSRAVAFEALLSSGEHFASRLTGVLEQGRAEPQLAHIATDGETYGHHHRFGDMALAFALDHVQHQGWAQLTCYAQYLAEHPPAHEAQIAENTSWSCAHGVERWRADCGCGGAPGVTQHWRAPLREALDWLRDRLRPAWERAAGALLRDPWAARDDYIEVVLERRSSVIEAFLSRHVKRPLEPAERVRVLELLELQRHALLMYTSCGWFFEDLGRIETVQVLKYAARAIELGERCLGEALEEPFLERLQEATSNDPELGDGRQIWEREVRPSVVSLAQVTAQYALASLLEDDGVEARVDCYRVRDEQRRDLRAGAARLAAGVAQVESTITGARDDLRYCALHLGDHSLLAGVRPVAGDAPAEPALDEVFDAFERADLPETLRRLDRRFAGDLYTLRSLLRDEQRRIVAAIVESSVEDAAASYRLIFERHAPLMRYLADLRYPLPDAFRTAAELVIGADLRRAVETPDVDDARALLQQARQLHVELDEPVLRRAVERSMRGLAGEATQAPGDRALLERLQGMAQLAQELPFDVELWELQNRFWAMLQSAWPERWQAAEAGDAEAQDWCRSFRALGRALRVRVE